MNQAVYLGPYGRSTKGLAINALLVQLYQPELLTTGPAARVPSGQGFSAGNRDDTDAVRPQCPVWIGKDFRLDRTPRAPSAASRAGPTGAEAIGTPCCMARNARAAGCIGSSRCTWGSAERRGKIRGAPCAAENPAG